MNPVTYRKFREILSSQMITYNQLQKSYTEYHKMRTVAKGVKMKHPGTVGSVTDKDFSVANKKRQICKNIVCTCIKIRFC